MGTFRLRSREKEFLGGPPIQRRSLRRKKGAGSGTYNEDAGKNNTVVFVLASPYLLML